jgi:two-component system chemotaxis sensor kinase CheA
VVSDISGRGVGMDVVKTNIEKIGGTVDIQSRPGNGTTLKIRIPLTLAIIPALVVTCNGDRYAIPQVSLIELVRLEGDEIGKRIETINGAPLYRLRGRLLPLVYLRRVLKLALGVEADGVAPQAASIVVLQVGERQFGLVVDEVIDTEEIVVKPLGKQLKGIPAFAGATIMGDGRVALILDGLGIAQLSGVIGESREASRAEEQKAAGASRGNSQTLLLFSAGDCDRLAIPLSMVARLEEFPREQIEHAAGDRVVQYRGQILPLVQLASVLGSSGAAESGDRPTQVVVIGDANRTIGLEVDAILDIVEEAISATQMTNRPGLIGSAIVGQKVTDFLDLHSVIEQANSNWFEGRSASNVQTTILLVDDRAFSRSLLRGYLEMAKRTVLEASSAEEACKKLEREKVDTVAVSLDLPNGGAQAVLDYIRNRSDLADLPVLALREENQPGELSERFDDCQAKLNRAALLASVDRLLRNGRAGHTAAAEFAQTA